MKKWNSAFTSLAVSYLFVVLVIVLLLCSVFSIYFSGRYKEELRNSSRLILENTAGTVEASVLQRVQQIYLELSLDRTSALRLFSDASFQHNLSKVSELQNLLKAEVAGNPDIVQAVHLYAPKQQVMLSSLHGLTYDADQGESAAYFTGWIGGMRNNPHSSLWTPAREVPEDIYSSVPGGKHSTLITYARSYPFQSSGADSDLILAIDIKQSAISAIIGNMMPLQYEDTYIIDPSGAIIAGEVLAQAGSPGFSANGLPAAAGEAGSFSSKIGDTSYVISHQPLPSAGWTIVSAVPASFFYAPSNVMQQLILGLCLLALLLGFLLSGVLAKVNYKPVKRLTAKIRDLSGPVPEPAANEYRLIDTAFTRLSQQVSSLEESLQASAPAIKRNAVLSLLDGGLNGGETAEALLLLGITPQYSRYCCLLIRPQEAWAHMSSAHIQSMVGGIIEHLEDLGLPGCRIIAEELPDRQVAAIVCAAGPAGPLQEQLSQLLSPAGGRQLQADIQQAWGSWVAEITQLHSSFSEAQTLMKYAYFLPEQPVLNASGLLERENSLDEIPQALLVKFKDKLHSRQLDELISATGQLITAMREGPYPADYCHFILGNTVFVYSDYLKSIRYKPEDGGYPDLYGQYIGMSNILRFQDWLTRSLAAFITETDKRNSGRALSSVETAKEYIAQHLSDDLSLDAVSSKVFISPKYLSRLFKEELGMNYTDYVTGQRMEHARTLLESSSMTVEQIAGTVGYGTAAYFIKRFKERYGCTPGNYLRTVKEG
ncbi:HTH-type transcriptional activator Btr [compost metagenome]